MAPAPMLKFGNSAKRLGVYRHMDRIICIMCRMAAGEAYYKQAMEFPWSRNPVERVLQLCAHGLVYEGWAARLNLDLLFRWWAANGNTAKLVTVQCNETVTSGYSFWRRRPIIERVMVPREGWCFKKLGKFTLHPPLSVEGKPWTELNDLCILPDGRLLSGKYPAVTPHRGKPQRIFTDTPLGEMAAGLPEYRELLLARMSYKQFAGSPEWKRLPPELKHLRKVN